MHAKDADRMANSIDPDQTAIGFSKLEGLIGILNGKLIPHIYLPKINE